MKISFLRYDAVNKYVIMEISELPYAILDFGLSKIFENYKEWFNEYYDIDIGTSTYPVEGALC